MAFESLQLFLVSCKWPFPKAKNLENYINSGTLENPIISLIFIVEYRNW